MKPLIVVGQLQCDSNQISKVTAILAQLATDTTNKEAGCISYQYYVEIDNPNSIATIENWANREAEAAHWQTEHLKSALAKLEPLITAKPQMFKYQQV